MLVFYLAQIETESGRNRFTELYHDYYKLMFAVAFEKSKNAQSAEDIVHNAFVRIIKIINEDRLDSQQNVEGYLATITSHEAIKYWQKQHKETAQEDEIIIDAMPKENYTVSTFELEQLVQQVLQLNEKYKEPLKLYVEGYQIREIAKILELTESNVKQRLRRGRLMLLQTLEGNHA
ncbi:MAG: sigma-70 family RNA polymerase sigma factor [Oscillospiraceae bacterium]